MPEPRPITYEALRALWHGNHASYLEAQRVLALVATEADAVVRDPSRPREELAMHLGHLRRLLPAGEGTP